VAAAFYYETRVYDSLMAPNISYVSEVRSTLACLSFLCKMPKEKEASERICTTTVRSKRIETFSLQKLLKLVWK